MADSFDYAIESVIVEEHVHFTLPDLCRSCGVDREQLLELVHEGVLVPIGEEPARWQFSGSSLPRARMALRLARELEIGLAGVAVMMDLLDENATLRARLRQAGVE